MGGGGGGGRGVVREEKRKYNLKAPRSDTRTKQLASRF